MKDIAESDVCVCVFLWGTKWVRFDKRLLLWQGNSLII